MRALIIDHAIDTGLRVSEVERPRPAPSQALVKVQAFSLNYGDVVTARELPDGAIPGWEAAGHIVESARDGSGPPVGTPVVTLDEANGWAEYRAVDTNMIGVVPQQADLGGMSTVPVAANSALRALRRLGPILGRTVMVTGATGGVGRYAVQLARMGGATVVAVTSSPRQFAQELRSLGATEVISRPIEYDGPVHGVVECVGGALLVESFDLLQRDGVLVALGHMAPEPESFPPGALMASPARHNRSIVTFHQLDGSAVPPDLSWLSEQVTQGALSASVAWRGSWDCIDEAIDRLLTRTLHGKAVVEINH
ncbi:zinc-binding dehydrogenase [Streptomyces sp. SudanB66_2053]|uniref:zinc-binding dehydrogenase n=1 Tax=Streptomyces sp. SudanB66_2053 TaxID=3035277 RepID=UPI003F55A5A5